MELRPTPMDTSVWFVTIKLLLNSNKSGIDIIPEPLRIRFAYALTLLKLTFKLLFRTLP
jgi:hypothetical protein